MSKKTNSKRQTRSNELTAQEEQMELVLPYYQSLKAIFTNYPAALIKKLKAKGYQ